MYFEATRSINKTQGKVGLGLPALFPSCSKKHRDSSGFRTQAKGLQGKGNAQVIEEDVLFIYCYVVNYPETLKKKHLLSHNFSWSEIWSQLYLLLLTQVSHEAAIKVSAMTVVAPEGLMGEDTFL